MRLRWRPCRAVGNQRAVTNALLKAPRRERGLRGAGQGQGLGSVADGMGRGGGADRGDD